VQAPKDQEHRDGKREQHDEERDEARQQILRRRGQHRGTRSRCPREISRVPRCENLEHAEKNRSARGIVNTQCAQLRHRARGLELERPPDAQHGRTSDLIQAIDDHASPGSEANQVVRNFQGLSAADQQDLLNFLRSL